MRLNDHIRIPVVVALLLVLGAVIPGAARASVSADAPAAVVFNGGASNIVFFTGPDNGIDESVELDGQWSDPVEIAGTAGTATSGPAADVFRNGSEIDIFYRGTDNGIHQLVYSASRGWLSPREVPSTAGTAASAPGVDVFRNGTEVDLYYLGTSGSVQEVWYEDQHGWNPVRVPGTAGVAASAPTAGIYSSQVIMYFRGTDNGLHQINYSDQNGWSAAYGVPSSGLLASAPAVDVFRGGNEADVFYENSAGALGESVYNKSVGHFTDGQVPGTTGLIASAPAVDVYAQGSQVDVFYRTAAGGIGESLYSDLTGWQATTLPGTTPQSPAPITAAGAGQSLPTTTSVRGRHGRVRASLRITWTFTRRGAPVSQIRRVRVLRFERGARIAVRCLGHRCRFHVRRAGRKALPSLWRRLERVRFRSGERLLITISHRHRTPIRDLVRIRDRRPPTERQLPAHPRHRHHKRHPKRR